VFVVGAIVVCASEKIYFIASAVVKEVARIFVSFTLKVLDKL